jgi:hypothetical protein
MTPNGFSFLNQEGDKTLPFQKQRDSRSILTIRLNVDSPIPDKNHQAIDSHVVSTENVNQLKRTENAIALTLPFVNLPNLARNFLGHDRGHS